MAQITITKGDLFAYEGTHALVHCVSADFALGAGIAVQFNMRYNMRNRLKQAVLSPKIGDAVYLTPAWNLITKQRYWEKPTYETLRMALNNLKLQASAMKQKQLAMPAIGCGLDRLSFPIVKQMIEDIFAGSDISVLIVLH